MRRFSQKNSLVTLTEINVTPLLDLVFVLLIIFVITTPLLEQSIRLNLPAGGSNDAKKLTKDDIRTVEVTTRGDYRLGGKPINFSQLETELTQVHRANPNLVVYIRADENGPYKHVARVLDMCQRAEITRLSLRTQPGRPSN
jgi:biopolymer transport protein ExbD